MDLLRLRQECRRGLPNARIRARVWPLVLGINGVQLEKDVREYTKFVVTHNDAVRTEHEWTEAHRAYLVTLRAWEGRKHASKAAHEEFEKQRTSWDSFDDAGDRADESTAPPAFTEPAPIAPASPQYPTHYWDQITKDVDRSLWKQCPDETDRNSKRAMLHRMISAVLIMVKDDEGKPLHYFQGYHDLAGVCLLTCGEQIGYSVLKRLSTTYLRYVILFEHPITITGALFIVSWHFRVHYSIRCSEMCTFPI